MTPAKKQIPSSTRPGWLPRLFSWLLGAGQPVLLLLVLFGAIGGGGYLAWRRLGPRIVASPEYCIGPERVEITPLPAWIHTDVLAEIFRDPTLDGSLSIMDDGLTERIHNAFAIHPWVAKVVRVKKRHPSSADPASIKVELVYRQPVCMVEVPGGVLAVDGEGVVLPSEDFSPLEATRYPRLEGVTSKPMGGPGKRWGDAKVIGGAEIAAAFGPAWEAMRLARIVPLPPDATTTPVGQQAREPVFALFTRGGTRILWGYAPGARAVGELSASEKVTRLRRYLAQHDMLDGPQGKRQQLDVRKLPPSAGS